MRYVAVTTILLLLPLLLPAQRYGEDENLHIPPKLVVTEGWGDQPPSIIVQESVYPQVLLPLPMIFFENPAEWAIPERYTTFRSPSQARDYADTANVYGWPRDNVKYYEILNILGYRMRQDSSVVGLRGGYSTEPGEDAALAHERALVVREYLTLIWDIDTARLPILPTFSPVDSGANILLQQEARRVEFVTDDRRLFRPVPYAIVNQSPLNLAMSLYITPNVESDRVGSIEVRIIDEDRQVLGHSVVPGHPDSSVYRLYANWWTTSSRVGSDLSGIAVEARVVMTDGRYRTSEKFPVPIYRRDAEEDYERSYLARRMYGTIPFFPPGDTLLGPMQKEFIREYIALQDSLNGRDGRAGLFVVASGQTDMGENPVMQPEEINAEVSQLLESVNVSAVFYEEEETEESYLYIHMPSSDEEMYEEAMINYEAIVEEAEREAMVDQEIEDEEWAGVSRFDADSLAQGRARQVIAFIRDSLEVPLLNAELPAEMVEIRGEDFRSVRETGVGIQQNSGNAILPLPEQRWYHRGVDLFIETAAGFDGIQQQMQLQIEREKRRRERREEGVEVPMMGGERGE